MPMIRLDLRGLVRDIVRKHSTKTRDELAKIVESNIPDDKLRAVIRELLPYVIRQEMNQVITPGITWVGTDHSHKMAARRQLTQTGSWPVVLPRDMGGGTVELRDLTAADCEKLASHYESRSMEASENCRRYRELARAIKTSKAKKVGDLKRERVMMILGVEDEAGIGMLLHGAQ